jgi:hypothetical protein
MSKKINDDFEDDFEKDFDDIPEFIEEDESIEEDGDIEIDDDDDNVDIIIEIDEDDLDLIDNKIPTSKKNEDVDEDEESNVLSKHKIEGKHALKHDSIFKGKKEDPITDEDPDNTSTYFNSNIEVDRSSVYHNESMDNESYVRSKLVKEKVYEVLKEHTSLNFLNNRRKPSKVDFNNYYNLLLENLKSDSFTNVELFNELAVYFSDNLFNMFKLLDNKWRNLIINELQDHIGKNKNSKEITNRNIYEGTEIEFYWEDAFGKELMITGVVLETFYDESRFKVDSYENIYMVDLKNISKILNNTKFKYNLNKLNNIDFL